MKSAVDAAHFPAEGPPEVAFLGRSNVGKSSLLNSLVGVKVARVSNTPGRTQMINFFAARWNGAKTEPDLVLADLPGYGYARVPKAIVGEWPKFIEPYLKDRAALHLCVALVDSNIPAQKSDMQLMDWMRANDRDFVVVATKTDRLSGNKLATSIRSLKQELGLNEIIQYSSKTGKGKDELWKVIREAAFTL
jgi:GTP-binding protein